MQHSRLSPFPIPSKHSDSPATSSNLRVTVHLTPTTSYEVFYVCVILFEILLALCSAASLFVKSRAPRSATCSYYRNAAMASRYGSSDVTERQTSRTDTNNSCSSCVQSNVVNRQSRVIYRVRRRVPAAERLEKLNTHRDRTVEMRGELSGRQRTDANANIGQTEPMRRIQC